MKAFHRRRHLLLATLTVLSAFALPALAQTTQDAARRNEIKTEIAIPLAQPVEGYTGNTVADLANYIGVIYQFMISVIGLVAAVMMIIGGFQYLTSAGDSGKIGAAKKRITDALIGLTLAFSAFLLLNTINPALLRFSPIGNQLTTVTTQTAFLPFCEEMVKTLDKQISDIVPAKTTAHADGCRSCGCAGFIEEPEVDTSGKPKLDPQGKVIVSRLWCAFRGDFSKTKKADNSGYINNNCGEDSVFTAEAGSDNTEHQPMVCVPSKLYQSSDLEAIYKAQGALPPRVRTGACQSCAQFWDTERLKLGYTSGAQACAVWMNIANNGTPQNELFTTANKAETKFVLDSSRPMQMYYCNYSPSNDNCVYGNVRCQTHVNSCDDYDDEYITFCERADSRGGVRCLDEQLLTTFQGSYTQHLGPICTINPCNVSGDCAQSGLTQTLNALGSSGGFSSTVIRGATFGLLDPAACD
ncbi:MAG: pilin [Patescibacteria group bacterium]|jgi:hypothetical protein